MFKWLKNIFNYSRPAPIPVSIPKQKIKPIQKKGGSQSNSTSRQPDVIDDTPIFIPIVLFDSTPDRPFYDTPSYDPPSYDSSSDNSPSYDSGSDYSGGGDFSCDSSSGGDF